jgi:hypothetical protein
MILDEIVSIIPKGKMKTIDIEVDGDHLFFCNGILTHNSAAGDVADISEESIQGGISKIQSADNVIGFIPNHLARGTGVMRAKFLKTRDSGGVGSYIDFKTDWSTLTFEPWNTDQGGGAPNWAANANSNLPSQNGNNQREFKKLEKPDLKAKKSLAEVKSDVDENNDDNGGTAKVIRGIKGRTSPMQKKIKLL